MGVKGKVASLWGRGGSAERGCGGEINEDDYWRFNGNATLSLSKMFVLERSHIFPKYYLRIIIFSLGSYLICFLIGTRLHWT